MRWVLIAVIGIAGLLALIVVVGALLPRDHVAASHATIDAPPQEVWHAITDVERFPSWRKLQRVELLPPREGKRSWREVSGFGPLTFQEVEAAPPRRLVSRIVDDDQGFGGTWTFEITPQGTGSQLAITERGYVSNPVFRFLSRYVFGYHGTQEDYLRSLARKFGREAVPTRG